MLATSHGRCISARAHVHTALLCLGNGLTDCVQIWYVGCASLSTCFPQVRCEVGYLCTCARAPPSPCLRIRVANCAKIWCVAGDPIVTRFTRVGGGVTAHSHVRLQFRCLGNRWVLTLKPHQKQTYLSLSRSLVHRQTWRLTGWNNRLLTVASVCSPFYAEVLLTYISRSLSQRNNTYFQSKCISLFI